MLQICPILSDLMGSMSKIESLPPDFAPKGKVKNWYSKLYSQPASYELGEDEVRLACEVVCCCALCCQFLESFVSLVCRAFAPAVTLLMCSPNSYVGHCV